MLRKYIHFVYSIFCVFYGLIANNVYPQLNEKCVYNLSTLQNFAFNSSEKGVHIFGSSLYISFFLFNDFWVEHSIFFLLSKKVNSLLKLEFSLRIDILKIITEENLKEFIWIWEVFLNYIGKIESFFSIIWFKKKSAISIHI